MKITITMYDDFRYNFTCKHCYIDLKNHTFNIPGALGIDSIGFERLKNIEIKNVEDIEMSNEDMKDIKKREYIITQKIKYVESKKELFNKLVDILPTTVDEIEVSTTAGHCTLLFNEIFLIRTLLFRDMEEDGAWLDQKIKELEELKHEYRRN